MENTYYVYGLVDPRTDHIFYIGKGKNKRHLCHFKPSNLLKSSHKVNTIKQYRKAGFEDKSVIIADKLSNNLAVMLEIFLISYLGRADRGSGCLTNNTDGGENPPIGIDHPAFKAKINNRPWFNGAYSNFYGVKPWIHNKGNKRFWSNIDKIEILYNEFPNHKETKLRNLVNERFGLDLPVKPFYKALKMFKTGWRPYSDIEWIKFKENYNE